MREERHGDLIALAQAGAFDVIVHGCNCFCTMGAGIARPLSLAFPQALAVDKKTRPGDREKLGTLSVATLESGGRTLHVVNAYTQYHHSGKGVLLEYPALKSCFEEVARRFHGLHIAYPKIGAGLAGGDWARIEEIINRALAGEHHTFVSYSQ